MSDGKKAVAGDTFPQKLHRLLATAEQHGKTDVIAWLPDGTKFKVMDKTRFAAEIMPQYFSSSTFKSFQRSKNLWGFQTASKGVHKGECSHPLFLRNNPDLCKKMVRSKNADAADAVASGKLSPAVVAANATNVAPTASQPGTTTGIRQAPAGGNNFLNQALLSGMNPNLLLLQQQQQQQQQMASLNPLLGLGNNQASANPLLSSLASSLNGGGGNAALLAALQGSAQPAPPPPPQASTLQQLLQLAALQQQQQAAAAPSVNQQLMALLAQQSGAGNSASLGSPPLASVTAPPVQSIETHTPAKKSKSKQKGSSKKTSKNKSGPTDKEKTNELREAALEKGSKIVACRARGMSMDHNMHTAFFEIPKDPEHGMQLVCSFAPCRNGGIKFLWCKYCDDVIAKRTFKANHLHKDLVDGENGNENGEAATAADGSDDSKVPLKKRHKKNTDNVHEISNETTDSSSEDADDAEISAPDSKKLTETRSQWDDLLDERQQMDSKDDISNWLDRVVETSERYKKASRLAKRKAKA